MVKIFYKMVKQYSALHSSPVKTKTRRKTALTVIDTEDEFRRAQGMYELMKCMPTPPVPGKSYHILTGGNVDLLAHLMWVMQFWPKINHVFLSAWTISGVDILLCKRYIEEGRIGNIELLLGDIFPSKYKKEWEKLMEMYDAGYLTDIYNSTIHSKVMLIDCADGTKIVIESSANCNMNPRIEQSCVTVNKDLYEFYYTYLHGILDAESAKYVFRKVVKQLQFDYGESSLTDDERLAIERQDNLGEKLGE